MAATALEASIQNDQNQIISVKYFFDIITSEEVNIENQITDYVAEDGSTKQEHVVQPPIEFTIEGLVAEKVFRLEAGSITRSLMTQLSKLQPVAAFLPEVSQYAQAAIAVAMRVESTVKRVAQKISNLIHWAWGGAIGIKTQTRVIRELKALRDQRILVSVVSDLGVYHNMMIESVRMTQEETYEQSRLVIKLKQYNSVATQLTAIDASKYGGRLAQQAAEMQDLGTVQGKTMSTLRSWVSPNIVPYFTGVN